MNARCLFHNISISCGVGRRSRPTETGKMPVPQHINFLWGGHLARPQKQARCLFHNISISCGVGILPAHLNRQDACSTTYQFLVGWASCPPQKDLSLALLNLKLLHNPSHRFFHILPTIKRRNAEITLTRRTKTRTRSSHHIASFQQLLKEIPT